MNNYFYEEALTNDEKSILGFDEEKPNGFFVEEALSETELREIGFTAEGD